MPNLAGYIVVNGETWGAQLTVPDLPAAFVVENGAPVEVPGSVDLDRWEAILARDVERVYRRIERCLERLDLGLDRSAVQWEWSDDGPVTAR